MKKPSSQLKHLWPAKDRRRLKQSSKSYRRYRSDPNAYAKKVLNVVWSAKQREIAEALLRPPHKVLVRASHKVGKTYLAGGLANWWYDCYDPGIVITTAPTSRQVKDLLWKEVRKQRGKRGGFPGPKAARLESSPTHFAHGFTARDSDSFQGLHSEHSLFIFDEAVGVASEFWEVTESMFNEGSAWLAIFNPTDTSSQAYIEDVSGNWTSISISVLDHPNILADLTGRPAPFPAAARLSWLNGLLDKWCGPVYGTPKATDFEWPPQSGKYLRPGPIAEARLLGRWPSQATGGVWSDAAWTNAERLFITEPDSAIEIGCDVARFGDDNTAIHVRRGAVSLHHESKNGMSTSETAGRLKQLAREYGRRANQVPQQVLIKVDDDGVGGGVTDQREGFRFMGVRAGSRAFDAESYPNRRSELWFAVAERADENRLSLVRLNQESKLNLRRQAMAPTWKLDSEGRRVVEPKEKTKKRLKRSPDDMDALNLAYAPVMSGYVSFV